MKQGKLDFFPVRRALVLKAHDDSKSESNEVLTKLHTITMRQQKKVSWTDFQNMAISVVTERHNMHFW